MKTWMTIIVLYNSAAASKRPTLLTVITRLFLRQWCGLWAHTKALDKEKAIVVIYDSAAVAEMRGGGNCRLLLLSQHSTRWMVLCDLPNAQHGQRVDQRQ